MQYVQLVLTDSQAGLVATAVRNAALDYEGGSVTRVQLDHLADFFTAVEENPGGFPVTEPKMRRSIRKRISRTRGPAQPKPNKRKRAQLRSQGHQKRTRAQKQEIARIFNQAREAAEQALAIEQAQADRERVEALGIILPGSE